MSETLEAKGGITKEELETLALLSDEELSARSPEQLLELASRLGVEADGAALPDDAEKLQGLKERVDTLLRLKIDNPGVYVEGEFGEKE
jgi:hypothetical protein